MDVTTHKLELLTAANLAVPHGFTTRAGGVSRGPFARLNLGLSTGDDPAAVAENRRRVLDAFGVAYEAVCALQQVHGARVIKALPGPYAYEADAAVTDAPALLLVISTADCLPLLFHDPKRGAVGAAHCGWRGTAAGIAHNVIQAFTNLYGSDPADIRVAMGPGIQGPCYQVGPEVVAAFAEAGFPEDVYRPDREGRYRLDLVKANRYALIQAGVRRDHIHSLDLCTHCDAERFYSHRRDGLKRGSHWAVIKRED